MGGKGVSFNDIFLNRPVTHRFDTLRIRQRSRPGGSCPITEGLEEQRIGVPRRGFPVCYADDPAATLLGRLEAGRAALVVKAGEGWTSVFSTVPMLPARLMRNLARAAGGHRYIDSEDVVWASKNLLAVCARDAGKRVIRLPGKADVRDLYTGETVGKDVTVFEAEFGKNATRVFTVGP
ncbi:MAG: hypothetical protein RBT78_12415 [Kiritimatiellia bacterium]|nr:hypothetical protein [Kiritimatiellia bacterium]